MSSGSNTAWHRALQSGFGVIATPSETWYPLRFNGGGPTRGTSTEEDPEIGGTAGSVTAEAPATGEFAQSLWAGEVDWALEALFGGTWASDVLVPGTTLRYFTLQESQPDLLAGDKFLAFPDTVLTSLGLTFNTPNSRIELAMGISSAGGVSSAATIAGNIQSRTTTVPMKTGGDISNLQIDDTNFAALNLRCTQLTLNLTRATEDDPLIDVAGRGDITYGDLTAEVSMTVKDLDRTIYNTLFDGTLRKIEFTAADAAGNEYQFVLNGASPNGGEVSAPEKNTKRTQTLPFKSTDIQITRVTV